MVACKSKSTVAVQLRAAFRIWQASGPVGRLGQPAGQIRANLIRADLINKFVERAAESAAKLAATDGMRSAKSREAMQFYNHNHQAST